MKRIFSIFSSVLFFIGLAFYIAVLFGYDTFLLGGVIVSVIGFILALFGEKDIYKKIGLIGNGLIIFVTVLIPFIVTTFFWNEP
ncbi:hypothetical protein [Halobacillus amylolyticus]|uniref:Uncharacterized protein n=1 Tax=Halobacillus amylolyticus TaxID=2932259 RepID=A0ABY4HDS8_9BACI|nr:hypothetical protein [Halobacillus amylolyticus]UOR12812.1 hypothetical protein MUO15_04665 [Halobacillus amylolyticus]